MSDVAAAFKILISANPEMAVSAFHSILDSTNSVKAASAALTSESTKGLKSWGDSWTELNSKIDIAVKVFDFVKTSIVAVGGAMIDAGKATADFIAAGGDYNEQKVQFDAVAKSYGQSGDSIVKTLQDITDNNISLSDAMKLGSKAVATGLSEENGSFEVAMTFAKKWSEAKGESFKDVAETIVRAFATGKFASLKEMGIIADTSTTLGNVMVQMANRVKSGFVDAGNNSADAMGSIAQSWENLKLKVGQALNASGITDALVMVADDFAEAINNIDYSRITDGANELVNALKEMASQSGITWESSKALINESVAGVAQLAKTGIPELARMIVVLPQQVMAVAKEFRLLSEIALYFTTILTAASVGVAIGNLILSVQTLGVVAGVSAALVASPFATAALVVTGLTAAMYGLIKAYEWFMTPEVAELGYKAQGKTVDEILAARKERQIGQAAIDAASAKAAEDSKVQIWNDATGAWENAKQTTTETGKKAVDLVALAAMKSQRDDFNEAKQEAADTKKEAKEIETTSKRSAAFQKSLSGSKSQQAIVDVTKEQSGKIDDLAWYLSKVADALAQPVRVVPANTTGAIEQLIFEVIRQATILSREEGVKVLAA